jgi:hypothetical protein
MGHRALGLTGIYFKPTPNDLLEGNDKMLGYANIMKSLTISEEHKLRLEVRKLSAKNDDSQHLIEASLKEKDRQIKSMKAKYDDDIALLKDAVTDMQTLLKNSKIVNTLV